MWVDIDDLRADLERLCKKAKEEFVGEKFSKHTTPSMERKQLKQINRLLNG